MSWMLGRAPTPVQAIASIVLGVGLVGLAGRSIVGDWLSARSAQAAAQAIADSYKKKQAELAAQVPERIAEWRAKLVQVNAAAAAAPFVDGSMPEVDGVIADAKALASSLSGPIPSELSQVQVEAAGAREKYAARQAFDGAVQDLGHQVLAAQDQVKAREWIAADECYATALQDIDSSGKGAPWLTQLLPFDLGAKQKEVAALRARIAVPVASEKQRAEKAETEHQEAEAKRAAHAALCGEAPAVSGWDGALAGLESVLKETANDPDSIEVKNCSAPMLSDENCWVSTCDVRGKNAFGAKILKRLTFAKNAFGFQQLE